MINAELTEHIHKFRNSLLLLVKDYGSINEIDNENYLKLNANFLYIFSIFERLIGDIIETGLKEKKELREKYFKIFEALAEEKIKNGNQEHDWTKFFNQPKVMLDNYNVLEKEKTQIVLAKILIGFDTNQKILKTFYKQYCEIRERRNLLIHRGEEPDKIYYQTLRNKYKINKKFLVDKIFAEFGLYTEYKEWNQSENKFINKPNVLENPKNISVTPVYLINTASVLHSFALIMISHCWDHSENNKYPEKESALSSLHDMLLFYYDNKFFKGFSDSSQTFFYFLFLFKSFKNALKNLDISDKVNLLIIFDYFIRELKEPKKRFPLIPKLLESINSKDETYEHNEIIYQLMDAHIKNNIDLFIDASIRLFDESDSPPDYFIDNWLMFRKFREKKKFKERIQKIEK